MENHELVPSEKNATDTQILKKSSGKTYPNTGELGYDRLNGTRKIDPSYAKSVIYIWRILDMHWTGTKHIVRRMQKSVVQWSVISKFTCNEKKFWTKIKPFSIGYRRLLSYRVPVYLSGEDKI